MKKLYYILIIALGALASCNEDDLDHLLVPEPVSGGAIDVVFEPGKGLFDITTIETSTIEFDIIGRSFNNGELIAQAEIFLVHTSALGVSSDTIVYFTYSNGSDISRTHTAGELMSLVGLDPNSVGAGDRFDFFINEVVMDDGRTFTAATTQAGVTINRGDFAWTVFVACPFNPAEVEGTYSIVVDELGVALNTEFEVVNGPEDGQVTFVDWLGHGFDLVVDITDPTTGAAGVAQQEAWDSGAFGLAFGIASAEGTGFVFSCSGTIVMNLEHTVAAGSFGTNGFVAQR